METSDRPKLTLPENAYRKLKAGEEYQPIVPADRPLPEATPYSVGWGLFYAVLFSAGAAYLGLKIGQVFEAAIPIAILAVGASAALGRKNALSENVIIQSIGAASGVVVAGAIFTLPGLYILGLQATYIQMFLSSLFGGFLGILFLIPFRRFFVKDMHGEFPFPEATATTEILVAGETGGNQARVLLGGAIVGGIYDFLVSGIGAWKEVVSTTVFGWGQRLADTIKWEFRINVGAAVTGLGYIIGLRYSAIICAGSFTAWWVLVPLVYFIGSHVGEPFATHSGLTIAQMPPRQIFADYVRHVGIGGIAAAGIIGVLKSWRIIVGAFKLALREFTGGIHAASGQVERTQHDIAMKWVMTLILATILAIFAFFRFGVVDTLSHALVGLVVVTVIAFLFTTVAARAIAIVGVNPVSGMTLMTLIISSVVLLQAGVTGRTGILAALIIGGVVCTALSMAGGFITDLKIGYWLGTTPRTQERWKFLGTLAAAASVGVVIMMLGQTDGFGAPTALHPHALAAPQASAMAAVIEPLMTGQPAPWLLYIAGIFLAIVLEIVRVPALAFALGMYLPIELNTPLLFGGLVAWYVASRSKDEKLNTERRERGTLIASGFIAGGAIMGVVAATINFIGDKKIEAGWRLNGALGLADWVEHNPRAEMLGFGMFTLLLIYFAWASMRNTSQQD